MCAGSENRRCKSGKSSNRSLQLSKLLKFPSILTHTTKQEAKNLRELASGLTEIRSLQRDRLTAMAQRMLKECRLEKEIEVAEVTATEEGFTVEFRFRA